jgi:flagellar motor switch protein FliM
MLQVAAPNEIVVAVVFDVKIGEVRGLINVCIPASIVESTGTSFAQARQKQRRELAPTEAAWMAENLGRVRVPFVPLIRTRVSASAVLAMRPGEVIALPLAADQPVDVYAGGIRKFTGRLAADRGRLMVMIEGREKTTALASTGAS